jgi:hypothetical protein
VGPAIGRSDRLYIWGDTNPDFIFCVVAALSSPFRRNAEFTITLWTHHNSISSAISTEQSLTIFSIAIGSAKYHSVMLSEAKHL